MFYFFFFFFFKQKTAYDMCISDWSSDVCSSDLLFRNLKHCRINPPARGSEKTSARVGTGSLFIPAQNKQSRPLHSHRPEPSSRRKNYEDSAQPQPPAHPLPFVP